MRSIIITPVSYKNWLLKNQGAECERVFEFPLYTDASCINFEIRCDDCPYQIVNPAVITRDNIIRKRLILRLEDFRLSGKHPNLSDTELQQEDSIDLYLEYSMADHIAVLLSLVLGIRVKAGNADRSFRTGEQFGEPIAHMAHADPQPVKLGNDHLVLPSALTNIYNNDKSYTLKIFEPYILSYIKLKRSEAALLIRAAKLYRNALWIVESEPELSWIMLVSAIETVAKDYIQMSKSAVEIFSEIEEGLSREISRCGGEELLIKVAERFVDKKYSGRKYREFLIKFLPEPPLTRPLSNMQINWEDLKQNNNKNPFSIIYDYRSKALHQGESFRSDMCYAPMRLMGAPYDLTEKNSTYVSMFDGRSKTVKPGPMLISIFEYIVRNVLLNWWKSCIVNHHNNGTKLA